MRVRKSLRRRPVWFLFGLTWSQLSGCRGRQLCGGASGCERGLLTPPNFPPTEPVHRKRAGCGNGPDWLCRGPLIEENGRKGRIGRKRRTMMRCERARRGKRGKERRSPTPEQNTGPSS